MPLLPEGAPVPAGSGQLDRVVLREFVPGTEEETKIRSLLDPVVEKVTFPTAELTPGNFTTESDAIVAHFAERAGVEPEVMPTYQSYLTGVFKNLGELYGRTWTSRSASRRPEAGTAHPMAPDMLDTAEAAVLPFDARLGRRSPRHPLPRRCHSADGATHPRRDPGPAGRGAALGPFITATTSRSSPPSALRSTASSREPEPLRR